MLTAIADKPQNVSALTEQLFFLIFLFQCKLSEVTQGRFLKEGEERDGGGKLILRAQLRSNVLLLFIVH